MKCSHGLPYEVKCHGCMLEALSRIGVAPLQAPPVMKMHADNKPTQEQQVQQWNKSSGISR